MEFGGKHTLNIFVGDVLIQTGQLDALVGVLQVDGNTEPESAIYATKYLDRVSLETIYIIHIMYDQMTKHLGNSGKRRRKNESLCFSRHKT